MKMINLINKHKKSITKINMIQTDIYVGAWVWFLIFYQISYYRVHSSYEKIH